MSGSFNFSFESLWRKNQLSFSGKLWIFYAEKNPGQLFFFCFLSLLTKKRKRKMCWTWQKSTYFPNLLKKRLLFWFFSFWSKGPQIFMMTQFWPKVLILDLQWTCTVVKLGIITHLEHGFKISSVYNSHKLPSYIALRNHLADPIWVQN